ncbi:MAG TPA: hypothetical protein VNS32_02060 [Flavisolibacter sp.]|nr:hypothetical protein [Flavisolibacter sp.]
MYPYDFGFDFMQVTSEISIRPTCLRDFHEMLKSGVEVYNTHSYAEVNALCNVGFFDSSEVRSNKTVLLIESQAEGIPAVCFEVLLDLILWIYQFRFQQKNSSFPSLQQPEVQASSTSEKTQPTEEEVRQLYLEMIQKGIRLLYQPRFALAIQRFGKSYLRTNYSDVILDCCSATEAFFNFSKELKLRYTLAAYHYDKGPDPQKTSLTVKQMYELRNKIVHGKFVQGQIEPVFVMGCMEAVAKLFLSAIKSEQVPSQEDVFKRIVNHYREL